MSDLTVRILQEIRGDLREVRDEVRSVRSEHGAILRDHGAMLREHGAILREHSEILKEHSEEFRELRLMMRGVAAHKERDTILLANELGDVKRRLGVCEDRLGITKP